MDCVSSIGYSVMHSNDVAFGKSAAQLKTIESLDNIFCIICFNILN